MARIADFVGRVVGGKYRLVAPIGTGASAHVFLADDVVLRRRVAVKILHAALADDESFLRRFRVEAQSAAGLNHPHVMRVFDTGEDADGPYLVLEYLDGGSLRDLLDRGHRLSISQAAVVGLEAARALDYAHRRGLVHRDIKPANLLFDEDGRLRVADFGLARALAEAAWTEPAGAVIGTARYASPEQARGGSVDGKADVYALSLVLVETVTGAVPFSADTTIATLMARTERSLVAPAALGPLGPILEQAGALDAADRPEAGALVRQLEAVARDLPAAAPLPLAGGGRSEMTEAVERDPTILPPTRGRLYDADADETGAHPEEAAPALPRRTRRRRWWIWLATLVAALAVLAGGLYGLAELTVPKHPVPPLRGETLATARSAADKLDFKVKVVAREYEDDSQPGEIIDQDPASGSLREGSTIKLTLSRGPTPIDVPDLNGLDEAAAQARLTEAGFTAVVARRDPNEDVPAGIVLEWSPKATKFPKGSEVSLIVSAGPPPRKISDWKGKSFEEAKRGIETAGLVVKREDVYSDAVPQAGRVVSTSPGPAQEVAKGGTVVVRVSKGPETFAMPEVRGKSVDEATTILEGQGLHVTNVYGPPKRRVIFTNPQAGQNVKRGQGVDLYTGN